MASNDVEFLNFVELFEVQLNEQNFNIYIGKYNDFCNYRLSCSHLGDTFERTFIKWKIKYDAKQGEAAQPKKLNPTHIRTPYSLTKIKQENPDTGEFYTFTLYPNIKIPNTPSNEATNPINIPNTPTKQPTDHLVNNYLQNTVPQAANVE